jgi:predicted 2-oxoglutarate/Fe(II)-dependent dioxygenase YbiX
VFDPSVRTASEIPASSLRLDETESKLDIAFFDPKIAVAGPGPASPEFLLCTVVDGPKSKVMAWPEGGVSVPRTSKARVRARVPSSGHQPTEGILQQVHTYLLLNPLVDFVPCKLNVYGPGGFFKAHVDTPAIDAAKMLGTVVICLPSKFEGGDLVVQPPPGTTGSPATVFSWSEKSGDGGQLQWAAFFGDCVHEVLPVTSGYRVTVTYFIMSNPDLKREEMESYFDVPYYVPMTTVRVMSSNVGKQRKLLAFTEHVQKFLELSQASF